MGRQKDTKPDLNTEGQAMSLFIHNEMVKLSFAINEILSLAYANSVRVAVEIDGHPNYDVGTQGYVPVHGCETAFAEWAKELRVEVKQTPCSKRECAIPVH